MKLGVDLDETLINNKFSYENTNKWRLKKGAIEYLPSICKSHELHLITARESEDDVMRIVNSIENILSIQFKSVTLTRCQKKGGYAASLGCKLMFDDNPDYLSDCAENGVMPVLLGKRKYAKIYKNYTVCENWKQFSDYLSQLDSEGVVMINESNKTRGQFVALR